MPSCPSACLFSLIVFPPACLPAFLSLCLLVHPTCLPVCLSSLLPTHPSPAYLSTCLSSLLPSCLPAFLVSLSACMHIPIYRRSRYILANFNWVMVILLFRYTIDFFVFLVIRTLQKYISTCKNTALVYSWNMLQLN